MVNPGTSCCLRLLCEMSRNDVINGVDLWSDVVSLNWSCFKFQSTCATLWLVKKKSAFFLTNHKVQTLRWHFALNDLDFRQNKTRTPTPKMAFKHSKKLKYQSQNRSAKRRNTCPVTNSQPMCRPNWTTCPEVRWKVS